MEAAEKIREADYIFGAKRLLRTTKNEQGHIYNPVSSTCSHASGVNAKTFSCG